MTVKKKRIIILTVIMLLFVSLVIWIIWGNTALELNTYIIESEDLPKAFDGYRIAHISDLHNAEFGNDNEKLLSLLKDSKPDIIAITGDLIDSRNTNIEIALHFAEEAALIAPCYYVTGNHEARKSENVYADFETRLVEVGVVVLHNTEIVLEHKEASISLLGIDDPSFAEKYSDGIRVSSVSERIGIISATDNYTILLSHRPELFSEYVKANVDLVLCGHAHGGQFRLPFVGGLVAPGQGLFPQYDAGLFTEGNTNMIVSRGIGNSIIPFRFNNRPEVIIIELQSK